MTMPVATTTAHCEAILDEIQRAWWANAKR